MELQALEAAKPAFDKYGASLLGLCAPDVRLPLVEATEAARAQIKKAMQGAGLKF